MKLKIKKFIYHLWLLNPTVVLLDDCDHVRDDGGLFCADEVLACGDPHTQYPGICDLQEHE